MRALAENKAEDLRFPGIENITKIPILQSSGSGRFLVPLVNDVNSTQNANFEPDSFPSLRELPTTNC